MLSTLEKELVAYAESFYTDDEQLNRNLRLKLAHTFRVRNETTAPAAAEAFPPEQARLAVRAALLHDLSRFEQFARFGTFKDAASFDHGDRSAELAAEQHLLDDLDEAAQADVLDAIRSHNKLAIPGTLSECGTVLAQVVRDADKIDIMPILFDYLKHPTNKSVVLNLAASPEITPAVWDDLAAQRTPPHAELRTVADFVSAKLNWVYDLNYPTSRRIFRERGYLETLKDFLPHTQQVETLYRAASARLAQ